MHSTDPDTQIPLIQRIEQCQLCADDLPHAPRPVVRFAAASQVLVVGQAPGRRVHQTGIPWNDPSGDRLRNWLGVDKEQFYNTQHFAIVPMGFCYPGTGKSGDLPPMPRCAPQWHAAILQQLPNIQLTLLIGQYAQQYYLSQHTIVTPYPTLTDTVQHWREYLPYNLLPMPHPSPRNGAWFKRNPWFQDDVIPWLQQRLSNVLMVYPSYLKPQLR